jgi:hypothetical protein
LFFLTRCRTGQRKQPGGLRDCAERGRKPILSLKEQQAVAERLEEGPQEGAVCSLRGLDFQQFIEDQFGKLMSLSACLACCTTECQRGLNTGLIKSVCAKSDIPTRSEFL